MSKITQTLHTATCRSTASGGSGGGPKVTNPDKYFIPKYDFSLSLSPFLFLGGLMLSDDRAPLITAAVLRPRWLKAELECGWTEAETEEEEEAELQQEGVRKADTSRACPAAPVSQRCSSGALRWKAGIIAVDNLQVIVQLKHLPLLCGSGL